MDEIPKQAYSKDNGIDILALLRQPISKSFKKSYQNDAKKCLPSNMIPFQPKSLSPTSNPYHLITLQNNTNSKKHYYSFT
mmetsp:Transcript_21372/g.24565  ORF Transcript_21372/g.24565 Transcript_21372/m.24565 type:complete len:80 (-) Transcript_21372:302-541(-)